MAKRKMIFWFVLFGLFALTLVMLVVKLLGEPKEVPQPPVPVEVETVSRADIEQIVTATGAIESNATVNIMPKVSGRLESLSTGTPEGGTRIEEGVAARKGEQIGLIDRALYVAAAEQARAQARAAEADAADAEREQKRMISLFESGSATEQMRDKAVTAAKTAAARLGAAKAALELAEINLQESVLKSPMDGVVTRKYIDEGNLVSVGQPVVTIADIAQVKVIVAVSEKHTTLVKEGVPCRLMVDAYPDKVFAAKVSSVWPALDPATRSLQVEIRLDNPGMELKPGMFAKVDLILERKTSVIVIPFDSVTGGKVSPAFVYTVNNSVAYKHVVEPGIVQADKVEVISGLNEGEELVVNGMTYLKDGMAVEVVSMEAIK